MRYDDDFGVPVEEPVPVRLPRRSTRYRHSRDANADANTETVELAFANDNSFRVFQKSVNTPEAHRRTFFTQVFRMPFLLAVVVCDASELETHNIPFDGEVGDCQSSHENFMASSCCF
ncbi:MAG: hypothetical protein IRZ06_12675 [Nevskia sp.]|nr:hypothetical protein [Nevskia sp.]